jgi:ribosomal protein S12 methylthiotransferase accessory factor
MAALGEAIERYSIGLYRGAELVRASANELGGDAVDVARLVFFADEQYAWPAFPYARFIRTKPLSWVVGRSLLDGRERLVPAARVFTPYRSDADERLLQSTSTGAACHVDRDTAILAGVLECIERDAVMIAWLNRLPLSVIPPEEIGSGELSTIVDRLGARGLTLRLLDATTDVGVPTVVAMLAAPPGATPALAFGAATRPTIALAAEKAAIESAHTFFWIHTRARATGLPPFRDDYADVTALDLHSLLYGHDHMRSKTAFLTGDVPDRVQQFKAGVRASLAVGGSHSPAADLHRCVGVLRRLELEPIVIDVTPTDVADLGFVVVRVVVTDLHPLWGGHHVRCLGGRRVRDVPVRLGYAERPRAANAFNADPHPLP